MGMNKKRTSGVAIVGLVLLANTETPAAGVVGDAPEMLATWVAGR